MTDIDSSPNVSDSRGRLNAMLTPLLIPLVAATGLACLALTPTTEWHWSSAWVIGLILLGPIEGARIVAFSMVGNALKHGRDLEGAITLSAWQARAAHARRRFSRPQGAGSTGSTDWSIVPRARACSFRYSWYSRTAQPETTHVQAPAPMAVAARPAQKNVSMPGSSGSTCHVATRRSASRWRTRWGAMGRRDG
ncbi:MAG: hypothetical protein ABI846_16035 [Rudaea sp.]